MPVMQDCNVMAIINTAANLMVFSNRFMRLSLLFHAENCPLVL
jgi:hypothetical protein